MSSDSLFRRLHDHPEVCVFGGPKEQYDAAEPRYSLEIIGPESLVKELLERIDNPEGETE